MKVVRGWRATTSGLLVAAAALLGNAARAATDSEAGAYAVLAGGLGEWRYDCSLTSGCSSAASTAVKLGAGWRWQVFALEVWAFDYGSETTAAGTRLHPRALGLGAAWQWSASPQVDIVLRTGLVQVDRVRSRTSEGAGYGAFGLALVGRMTSSLSYEVAWDSTSALIDRFANTFTVGVRAAF